MKQGNKFIKISKVLVICTLIISVLFSYNQVNSKATVINKTNKSIQNTYNKGWQLISRARYIKGTIVSLKKSSNGKYILNLKVEVNYHSKADPVESLNFPFKIGNVVEFVLKDKPKINLSNGKRIIIYQGQITTNEKDNFLGANIKYYEYKHEYFDMNGKKVTLPPKDYPNSL